MNIYLGNCFSRVEGTPKEERFLSRILSFKVPGYQYTRAFRRHYWDGTKKLFNKNSSTYPTGLTPAVLLAAKKKKFDINLIPRRRRPRIAKFRKVKLKHSTLRDYQSQAIRAALYNRLNGVTWPRGVFEHATGSGKTILASGVIYALSVPTLYLVQRLDLLHQTHEVLERELGIEIGLWGGGKFDLQKVTIGMIQSVTAALDDKSVKKYLSGIDLLIMDECHHVGNSNTYYDIAKITNAYYRFGFSGTALRRKDLGDVYLIGALGEVLHTVKPKELVERGLLARPTIHIHEVTEPVIPKYSIWNDVYQQGVVLNVERNRKVVAETMKSVQEGRSTLILVRILEHGRQLKRLFLNEGMDVVFLQGVVEPESRKYHLKRFRDGKNKLLIASTIFDEGIDIPQIGTLIIASAGESEIKTIQRLGRSLRPKPGENKVTVVDFLDRTHKFLLKHSLNRIRVYQQEEFDVQLPEKVSQRTKA